MDKLLQSTIKMFFWPEIRREGTEILCLLSISHKIGWFSKVILLTPTLLPQATKDELAHIFLLLSYALTSPSASSTTQSYSAITKFFFFKQFQVCGKTMQKVGSSPTHPPVYYQSLTIVCLKEVCI